jgi:GTPase
MSPRPASNQRREGPRRPLPPVERLPVVAIVGRPNVGKSTLFNRLLGERRAIVEDVPGVTRDRNYAEAVIEGRRVLLVDTGGFDPEADEGIWELMRGQVELAIDEADAIVLLLDAKDGLNPTDEAIYRLLEPRKENLLLVVNKADNERLRMDGLAEAFRLGAEDPMAMAAKTRRNLRELRRRLLEILPEGGPMVPDEEEEEDSLQPLDGVDAELLARVDLEVRDSVDELVEATAESSDDQAVEPVLEDEQPIAVAVVGRPNAGKSTLVNQMLGTDRHLTSEVPGTTRDSIDSWVLGGEHPYLLIDTAGLRRKSRISDRVERYSVLRALESARRADVVCLLVDPIEGVTTQDKKIAHLAAQYGKAAVLLVNKWDMVKKDTRTAQEMVRDLREELPFLDWAPILFVSALTGQRVHRVLAAVDGAAINHRRRISTGELNRHLAQLVARHQPPIRGTRRPRIFYGVQTAVQPPTFVLFVSERKILGDSYLRYLMNGLRERVELEGSPIRIYLRERTRSPSKRLRKKAKTKERRG